jgi:hypothetical protein
MIDDRGPVRLTDLGLATAVATVHNLRSGTPAYGV